MIARGEGAGATARGAGARGVLREEGRGAAVAEGAGAARRAVVLRVSSSPDRASAAFGTVLGVRDAPGVAVAVPVAVFVALPVFVPLGEVGADVAPLTVNTRTGPPRSCPPRGTNMANRPATRPTNTTIAVTMSNGGRDLFMSPAWPEHQALHVRTG